MKKSYHVIRKQGKTNEQEHAGYLAKRGSLFLLSVDLIEQCRMACEELIDVTTGGDSNGRHTDATSQ